MDFFRKPAFIIGLIVVVIIALGWSYIAGRKTSTQTQTETSTQTPTVSNLSNLDPADFDTQVKDEFALANSKATEAKSGNKISMIEVSVDKDLSVDSISTRYVYSADSDAKNNWIITISAINQSYLRALIPKDDYVGNVAPFDASGWKYNYVTALQLAEKAGGLDWREQNTLTGVTLTLKNAGTNNLLTWSVKYSAGTASKTINLDAGTGKVIADAASTDTTSTSQ